MTLFGRLGDPFLLKFIECGFQSRLHRLGLRLRFAEPGADVGEDCIDFLEIGRAGAFELQFELARNSSVSGRFQKLRARVLGNRMFQDESVILGKIFDR